MNYGEIIFANLMFELKTALLSWDKNLICDIRPKTSYMWVVLIILLRWMSVADPKLRAGGLI